MNFSVIIPFYNEEKNIIELNDELTKVLEKIETNREINFEILYIDDGSIDNTFQLLNSIKNKIKTVIIKNFTNLSQSVSIMHGIDNSCYENIILMDGDLQNDPKDFEKIIDIYIKNNSSIVHGIRTNRMDPYFSKVLPSKIANFIVRFLTKSKILDHGCSLKAFNKNIIETQDFFGDFHRLFAAQVDGKINIIQIDVNHRPRMNGSSNYGFERVLKILIDIFFLKLTKGKKSYFYTLGIFGIYTFFLSFISFMYMIYLKFFEGKSFIETPLPVIVIFFALSGLIFFSISLILETIKKLFNEKTLNKKLYEIIKK